MTLRISPVAAGDWPEVREIYRQGIATGHATFETELPDWEKWDRDHLPDCRLVACSEVGIVGWAALSSVSRRQVHAGVAEVSIYVAEAARGLGAGTALLRALIAASERSCIWTLQAGIFPENTASIALHQACGFRQVGTRHRVGKLGNRWRDTVLLERRSETVGI